MQTKSETLPFNRQILNLFKTSFHKSTAIRGSVIEKVLIQRKGAKVLTRERDVSCMFYDNSARTLPATGDSFLMTHHRDFH